MPARRRKDAPAARRAPPLHGTPAPRSRCRVRRRALRAASGFEQYGQPSGQRCVSSARRPSGACSGDEAVLNSLSPLAGEDRGRGTPSARPSCGDAPLPDALRASTSPCSRGDVSCGITSRSETMSLKAPAVSSRPTRSAAPSRRRGRARAAPNKWSRDRRRSPQRSPRRCSVAGSRARWHRA